MITACTQDFVCMGMWCRVLVFPPKYETKPLITKYRNSAVKSHMFTMIMKKEMKNLNVPIQKLRHCVVTASDNNSCIFKKVIQPKLTAKRHFSFVASTKKCNCTSSSKWFFSMAEERNIKVTAHKSSVQPATQRCHRWLYFYFPSSLTHCCSLLNNIKVTFVEYQSFSQWQWNSPERLFSI